MNTYCNIYNTWKERIGTNVNQIGICVFYEMLIIILYVRRSIFCCCCCSVLLLSSFELNIFCVCTCIRIFIHTCMHTKSIWVKIQNNKYNFASIWAATAIFESQNFYIEMRWNVGKSLCVYMPFYTIFITSSCHSTQIF